MQRKTQIRLVRQVMPDETETRYFGYVEINEDNEITDVASLDYTHETDEEAVMLADGIQSALELPEVVITQTKESLH